MYQSHFKPTSTIFICVRALGCISPEDVGQSSDVRVLSVNEEHAHTQVLKAFVMFVVVVALPS